MVMESPARFLSARAASARASGENSVETGSPRSARAEQIRLASRASGIGLLRFDCGESGSTLRFLIPIALALGGGGVFTGRGRLMERPQEPYFQICRRPLPRAMAAYQNAA